MKFSTLKNSKNINDRPTVTKIGYLFVLILMSFIISMFASISIMFLNEHNYIVAITSLVIGIPLSIVAIIFFYKYWTLVNPEKHINKSKVITKDNMKFFIILLVVYIIYQIIVSMFNTNGNSTKNINSLSWISIIIIWWFRGVVAPILEEITMRGVFLSLFFRKPRMYSYMIPNMDPRVVQMIAGVLVSAIISTLLHGSGSGITLLGFFVNGVIASILYYKTKHVFYPILFHFINNQIVVIVLILYYTGIIHV